MRDGWRVAAGSEVFLGLDISKASWHVTARSGGETLLSATFPPKREALKGLLKRLEGCQIHGAYETGPFGYGLHDRLRSRQVDSMVVSAAHVPGEIGNRVKTDRRDGLKLARTLEAGLLRPIFVPEARQRADRELVRQRQRVQKDRRAAMVRTLTMRRFEASRRPPASRATAGSPARPPSQKPRRGLRAPRSPTVRPEWDAPPGEAGAP